ncbi:MAG: 50S ribosomal protein L15 [Planctomycetota bacterium]|nr:MAG: 50S ribosomal protein L15 [Planctomycetota bacterium]
MNITTITTRAGAKPKRKRVGRGPGTGQGKQAGYGHKGQGARSGGRKERGLLSEGGVFPLFRRLPKVGFNNFNFRTEYQVVNLIDLEARFDNGTHVTAALLEEAGLIRDAKRPVKVLGDGEIKKKLTIEAQRFSKSAAAKIEAAGGTVKRLGEQPRKKFIKRGPVTGKLPKSDEGEGAKPEGGKKAKAKGEGAAPEVGAKKAKKKAEPSEGGSKQE